MSEEKKGEYLSAVLIKKDEKEDKKEEPKKVAIKKRVVIKKSHKKIKKTKDEQIKKEEATTDEKPEQKTQQQASIEKKSKKETKIHTDKAKPVHKKKIKLKGKQQSEKKEEGRKFDHRKGKKKSIRREKEEPKERHFEVKRREDIVIENIPDEITIMENITVADLARKMNIKASKIITKLMSLGMMATINQQIDAETAEIIASEYGCKVKVVSLYDETVIEEEEDKEEELVPRPPIVTVMGHVDHGKTKLLDAIRNTNIVEREAGGITQHIGAYQVKTPRGVITFIDTPGHEAFTKMRARGASVTDVVILVVAADDGIMPQTIEAINHAKAAGVPIVVAINKIDLPEANPDRVMQQLANYDLLPEEWGGKTITVKVSALKGEGIDELLESVLLEAELLELKANPNKRASGVIIESKMDVGRGPVATVLIKNGTLKVGDPFVCGIYYGKVRSMINDAGKRIKEAGPSTPVEIAGIDGLPEAGEPFHVVKSEKEAKTISQKRKELKRYENAQKGDKVSLDSLYDKIKEGEIKELRVIIKADVFGSSEAIREAVEKLSNDEVRVKCIHSGAGAITENDVMLASASEAIIIGFNVRATSKASAIADRENIEIRRYSIIYDVIDDIKSAIEGMLSPEEKEEIVGSAEVRKVIKVPKVGSVAGSYVTSGKILRDGFVRVIRDDTVIFDGQIESLKRFKDNVREVSEGYECGILIHNFNDLREGDTIECYIRKQEKRSLD